MSVPKSSDVDTVLTLFSELRNRTYTYVFDSIGNSDCEPNEYLALTHVCQQIRIEFRPIFMHQPVHAHGCISWLHAYLLGWDDTSVDKANFIANLHAGSVTECLYDGNSFVAFLQLYTKAHDINVHMPRDIMGQRAMLMLRCKAQWAKLFKKGHVAAVFCSRVSKKEHTLRLVLTRDFTASWLTIGPGGEKHIDNGARRFIRELGATELLRRKIPAAILGIEADKEGCAPLCHHALGRELPWGPITHGRGCSLYVP
jgi:hypothetical protein